MKNRLVLHLPFAVLCLALISVIWYVCLTDLSDWKLTLSILYGLFSYYFFKCCLIEPENPTNIELTEDQLDTSREVFRRGRRTVESVEDNKCQECSAWKSEGSRHCRICQQCYHRHFRHCSIVANCVAYSNVRNFVMMLIFLSILLATTAFQGITYIIQFRNNYLKNLPEKVSQNELFSILASSFLFFMSMCLRPKLLRFLMKSTSIIILFILYFQYDIKLNYETVQDLRVLIVTILPTVVLPTALRNILQSVFKTAYWTNMEQGGTAHLNLSIVFHTFVSLLVRQPLQTS